MSTVVALYRGTGYCLEGDSREGLPYDPDSPSSSDSQWELDTGYLLAGQEEMPCMVYPSASPGYCQALLGLASLIVRTGSQDRS